MEDRTFVEWDKDDLDALGILKVDVLGLGMLTCLRKAFELTEQHYGLSFRAVPQQKHEEENKRAASLDCSLLPCGGGPGRGVTVNIDCAVYPYVFPGTCER